MVDAQGISGIDDLGAMLNGIMMPKTERMKLNKKLANIARQGIRSNISKQVDVDGTAFVPRKKRAYYTTAKLGKLKVKRKMLDGFSRHLIIASDSDGFAVGFTKRFAQIADIHNQGTAVSAPSGNSYNMPKRQFLGWNKALRQKLLTEITQQMGAN